MADIALSIIAEKLNYLLLMMANSTNIKPKATTTTRMIVVEFIPGGGGDGQAGLRPTATDYIYDFDWGIGASVQWDGSLPCPCASAA